MTPPQRGRIRRWLHAAHTRLLPPDWPALRWLLLVFMVLQLSAIAWDLPCSFAWENDAVSPRDIFAGVALNLPGGHGHTYPLLHNLIVLILALPVLLWVAATAPSFSLAVLKPHLLSYRFMTPIALEARILAVLMGCVALAALARLVARVFADEAGPARRAGLLAAGFAATNLSFVYYGRVGNLDGPYLMWMALAAERLLDVAERGRGRDYGIFAALVAASIATKDQAYAAWVLPGIGLLVAAGVSGPWGVARGIVLPLAAGAQHARRLVRAIGVGALCLGVAGGGLLNPPAWLQRVERLRGSASQDWRVYGATPAGWWANLSDLAASLGRVWWPWPTLALVVLGLGVWLRNRGGVAIGVTTDGATDGATATEERQPPASFLRNRCWRGLPALLAVSFLCCFTLVVGRTGHRFLLPVGFFLSAYAGVGADALLRRPRFRSFGRWIVAASLFVNLGPLLALQLTQRADPRREVEARLGALPRGTTVETYDGTVSQPRFGWGKLRGLDVTRIGPRAAKRRNTLIEVHEVQAPYGEVQSRRPAVLLVPTAFAHRFVPAKLGPGRVAQVVASGLQHDTDGARFFTAAVGDTLAGYHQVGLAETRLPQWARAIGLAPQHIHSSLAMPILLLARDDFTGLRASIVEKGAP